MIRSLANKMAQSQAAISGQLGRKVRGTHAKGSCIEGTLTLEDSEDELYQRGPFGRAATVDVSLRFANGGSRVQADTAPDARAVSFHFTVAGKRYDFAMIHGLCA